MTRAYIGLGSNIGDGLSTLQSAWAELGKSANVSLKTLSSPYLSAPVGMESENWFTNAVGMVETSLVPEALLSQLLEVESHFGRRRDPSQEGYQDRTLDLDLLYFGQSIKATDVLTLPHPYLDQRLFVLRPLVEIALDFNDPVDGLTPAEKLTMLKKEMEEGRIPMQEIKRGSW